MDGWTRPFWEAAAREDLMAPRCASCGTFRWPPGPFCPECRSQAVEWVPAGLAQIYSYTILRQKPVQAGGTERYIAPALVAFPQAGGIRIMAAIVDTPHEAIEIGALLEPRWIPVGDTQLPQFRVR